MEQIDFINNTLEPNIFQIEDVNSDNACFYRSISNCFNYLTPSYKIEDIQNLIDYGINKPIEKIYQDVSWGYNGYLQDILARYLQDKIYKWIIKNKDVKLEEYNLDIKSIIELTHEISIDKYKDLYKYFAGDEIITYYDICNKYKSGKRKGKSINEKKILDNRWGGLPELIAISKIYHIPIILINSQKYNTKTNKIITGKIKNNKVEKNVRFKVIQIIGKEYICIKEPIFLLWKKYNNQGHYMSLYLKSKDSLNYFK